MRSMCFHLPLNGRDHPCKVPLLFHWWDRDLKRSNLLKVEPWLCLPILPFLDFQLAATFVCEKSGDVLRFQRFGETQYCNVLTDVRSIELIRN